MIEFTENSTDKNVFYDYPNDSYSMIILMIATGSSFLYINLVNYKIIYLIKNQELHSFLRWGWQYICVEQDASKQG
jgi:hypothetical protein